MHRVQRAVGRARALAERPWSEVPPASPPRRWLGIGDPQAPTERFFTVLDRAGVLGDDGMLRADVGLLSIGDHFDYGRDAVAAARDGLVNLRWLAEHPRERCVLLLGNHDVARVAELAFETDASFAAARALAIAIGELAAHEPGSPRFTELRAEFAARFPRIPTPEIAARDFSGFSTAQRALVQTLLVARRFALAATGGVGGHRALMVHAGVSARELAILEAHGTLPARDVEAIARALNAYLDRAVEDVAPQWSRGEPAALRLEPLHVAGTTGEEGGGLLYHRPVNPQRANAKNPGWETRSERPRRFDARTLPRGLLQVVGHTSHAKAREELSPWTTERAAMQPNGGLRTLRVAEGEPVYDLGVLPHDPGAATMIMIDPSMSAPDLEVPLLPLDDVTVPRP